MPRILFVSGFHPATRARDLAYEFERFGPLVRCDVPAPRNPHASSNPYAFVEFRGQRDAEDAYSDMHGRYFEGSRLSIQWAKNPPSSVWRYERRASPPSRSSRDRDRDGYDRDQGERRRRSRSRERRRSLSPLRDDRERDRDGYSRDRDRVDRRRRSRTLERRRSGSPPRDDRERERGRTPTSVEEPAAKVVEEKEQEPEQEREVAAVQTPPDEATL